MNIPGFVETKKPGTEVDIESLVPNTLVIEFISIHVYSLILFINLHLFFF